MPNEANTAPSDLHFKDRKEAYIKKRTEEELLQLELRAADTYSFGFLFPLWLLICSAPAVWYLVRTAIEGVYEKTSIDWSLFFGGVVVTVALNGMLIIVIGKSIKSLARIRAERRVLKIRLLPTVSMYEMQL